MRKFFTAGASICESSNADLPMPSIPGTKARAVMLTWRSRAIRPAGAGLVGALAGVKPSDHDNVFKMPRPTKVKTTVRAKIPMVNHTSHEVSVSIRLVSSSVFP